MVVDVLLTASGFTSKSWTRIPSPLRYAAKSIALAKPASPGGSSAESSKHELVSSRSRSGWKKRRSVSKGCKSSGCGLVTQTGAHFSSDKCPSKESRRRGGERRELILQGHVRRRCENP